MGQRDKVFHFICTATLTSAGFLKSYWGQNLVFYHWIMCHQPDQFPNVFKSCNLARWIGIPIADGPEKESGNVLSGLIPRMSDQIRAGESGMCIIAHRAKEVWLKTPCHCKSTCCTRPLRGSTMKGLLVWFKTITKISARQAEHSAKQRRRLLSRFIYGAGHISGTEMETVQWGDISALETLAASLAGRGEQEGCTLQWIIFWECIKNPKSSPTLITCL